MKDDFLLSGESAKTFYRSVRELPIIDYHCHLSPKEIFEDLPSGNIGELWLSGDHYKWRLMRACNIDERFITGDAGWHEKFLAYAKAAGTAAGSPLYHWTQMELSQFFNIETPLSERTASDIWDTACRTGKEKAWSPRRLILSSGVSYIATTDDVASSLQWHEKLRDDHTFPVRVTPSFRYDNLLLLRTKGYTDYIKKLSAEAGVSVTDLASLDLALEKRLDEFVRLGCVFTDLGIAYFPDRIADDKEADETFRKALVGATIDDHEFSGWLGNRIVALGVKFAKKKLVMQLHMAVYRNANTLLYTSLGPDTGGDCIGDEIPTADIVRILDAISCRGGLPKTILYTLNPAMRDRLASIAGCYRGVICGAAWWYCDHKRGIEQQLSSIAEIGHLGSFIGMLTDSRSFLSYPRHDYFRRILCSFIGSLCDHGEFDAAAAETLLYNICYGNIKKLIEESGKSVQSGQGTERSEGMQSGQSTESRGGMQSGQGTESRGGMQSGQSTESRGGIGNRESLLSCDDKELNGGGKA